MIPDARNAGVLLHVTSLPSKYGIGTLGSCAYDFLDWMALSGLKIWQVLPVVPTNYGDSPYQSVSSTALNYYMIDFDILNTKGLLKKKDYAGRKFGSNPSKVDFSLLFAEKIKVLRLAFKNFDINNKKFTAFVKKGEFRDFAVFMTIKSMHEFKSWDLWNEGYRVYSTKLEEQLIDNYTEDYLFWLWTQFEFLDEWNSLHAYAKKKNINIMGDMPLYVAYDSVEVWKNPELFILTEDNKLKLVAGCPPDAFTEDGQLWGNPIYNWEYHKKTNYEWWNNRLRRSFELFDIVRIDHFRGFDKYYAIPADHNDARNGAWFDGPKIDLFKDKKEFRIVAEDLGFIDDGVRLLMEQTGFPGMKILEFAFDGTKDNEHKPSNYMENFVVYTGTHDNMPLYQYILDLDSNQLNTYLEDLKIECKQLGVKVRNKTYRSIVQTTVELAFASKARICIIPMQDLLCQDGLSRMNLPATVSIDNWSYRILKRHLSLKLSNRIRDYVLRYGRN